jgi:hypothetical protein
MVSVVEVQGIKFTSKTFQIELEIKQCLVVSVDPFLDNCLIKTSLVKPTPLANVSAPVQKEATFVSAKVDQAVINVNNDIEDNAINESAVKETAVNEEDDEILKMLEMSGDPPVMPSIAMPSIAMPSIAMPSIAMPSIAMPSIAMPSIALNNLEIMGSKKEEVAPPPLEGKIPLHKETKKNTLINSQTTITPASLTSISNIKIGDDIDMSLPVVDIDFQDLTEVDFAADNSLETITLKKPNQVYYELYNEARKKAKECKKEAILAYLNAKNIKKTYMLEDSESDSDGSDNSDYSESDLEELEQEEE